MSYQAVDRVFEFSRAKGNARAVLLYLAHRAGVDGRDAHPTLDEIEAAACVSRSTVQRAIRELEEELKEIEVERGTGRGNHSRYHVLVGLERVSVDDTLSEKGHHSCDTLSDQEKVSPDDTLLDKGYHNADTFSEEDSGRFDTLSGDKGCHSYDHIDTRTLLENPTTTIPPEVDEESGAANEALVVVADEKEEGEEKPATALVEEMTAFGMTARIAERLAGRFSEDRIRRQIEHLTSERQSGREITNAGGRLRKMIEDDWAPPGAPQAPPETRQHRPRSPAPPKGYPPPSPAGSNARASYSGPHTTGPPASPDDIRSILASSGLR